MRNDLFHNWLLGASGGAGAMVMPYLSFLPEFIQVVGGLLSIAVSVIALYRMLRNKKD